MDEIQILKNNETNSQENELYLSDTQKELTDLDLISNSTNKDSHNVSRREGLLTDINYTNLILKNKNYKIEILDECYKNYDLIFKIIVIGNIGVGKSCLSLKATKDIFLEEYTSTIGFEFYCFNVKIDEKIIKLQIWDTCGQEIYRSLITNYYKSTSLAIIVYAINE